MGLAQRAGKIISGESMVKEALTRNKPVHLLIMAENASPKVKEEFLFLAEKKRIPLQEIGQKEELGVSIGKGERVIIAVIDNNFAKSLTELEG